MNEWPKTLAVVMMILFVGGPWILGMYMIVTSAIRGAGLP